MHKFRTEAVHIELEKSNLAISYLDNTLIYHGDKAQIDAILNSFDETSFVKQMVADKITQERVNQTEKLVPTTKWILILAQSIYIIQRQRKGRSSQKENNQLDQLEVLMDAITNLISIEETEIAKLDALSIDQMMLVDEKNIQW